MINLSGFAQSNNLSESSCKELAEEFINSTYCNKILNKYKKFFESFGISNPKELLNKKDAVGEETEINRDFDIEYTGRDYPFVYVNGSIILGNKGIDTHSQLLNKYMEETGNDFTGNEKLAFGQVAQGICFIETLENCNQEEVINALKKKKSDIKKVYDYDWQNKEVKRVARRKGKMCK